MTVREFIERYCNWKEDMAVTILDQRVFTGTEFLTVKLPASIAKELYGDREIAYYDLTKIYLSSK